ncbi:AfsR/SARP family transcriptional regulator [Glycomyces salinus]|uniref:AfsR/SARP family transcriptional regulator n=1 Tax=Glycomyces salinus TaxID=980294 RepID=UPI0018ED8D77|nr:BTAD domain-containing putative transcriptional regulator [Glycomyces salinus]
MEFRLLGPVEVLHDGARLPLPGRHLPRVLTVLLDQADTVVPSERLAAAMWDDPPPETARHQVHKAVSALRRTLGPAGDRLVTVGEGYRLCISPDELDLSRCRVHEDAARQHRREGRLREALDEIESGIALWRGAPLAGLSGRLVESIASRLKEHRVSLSERRADLKLALGEHGETVPELQQRCAEHPFRQRSVAQLMTALHRSGRTAEALETYGELRARLADELGLDPDDELQSLHRRILGNDLPAPDAASASPNPPPPAQLPADTGPLTGRRVEIETLDEILTSSDVPVALLSGPGGIGKTALAIHWGRLNRRRFADGQLYLNLRGFDTATPLEPLAALQAMLRTLGHRPESIPSDPAEAAALYRSLLADRSMLVVLDNARNEAQVRPLVPSGPGSAAIVTSRNQLTGLCALDGARMVRIGPLDRDASVRILSSLVGDDRLRGDREDTSRLAELCGYIPLALRLAGTNLASNPHHSPGDFIELLEAEEHRIGLLSIEGDPQAAVAAAFEHSLTALGPEAHRTCLRLALVPGEDFPDGLARAIMATSAAETDRAMSTLVRGHLLECHRPGRFRFHDLMKLYARQRAKAELSEEQRTHLVDRCIDWYIDNRDGEEFGNVLDACRAWSDAPGIWRLANTLRFSLMDGFRIFEIGAAAQLALANAERHLDIEGQAQMHSLAGACASITGDRETGARHGKAAIDLIAEHGTGDDSGRIRLNYGANLCHAGKMREAEPYTREALMAATAQGDKLLQMLCTSNLGEIQQWLGRFDEAETSLLGALELAAELGEPSVAWGQLIDLYGQTGQFDQAERVLDDAEKALEVLGESHYGANLRLSAGEMLLAAGKPERAKEALESSIALSNQLGQKSEVLLARCRLAQVESELGRPEEGMDAIRSLLEEINRGDDPELQLEAFDNASRVALRLPDHVAAREFALQAYRGFESFGYPHRQARSLLAMARAEAGLGAVSTAREHVDQALQVLVDVRELPEHAEARALSRELDAEA